MGDLGPIMGMMIKIIIGFFQIRGGFMKLDLQWPVGLAAFMSFTQIFKFDIVSFPGLDCMAKDPPFENRLYLYSLGPLLILFVMAIPTIVQFKYHPGRFIEYRNCFIDWSILLVILIYPPISETVFGALNCRDLAEDGRWLVSDFRVSCGESGVPFAFAYPALLWPLGLPLCLLLTMVWFGVPKIVKLKTQRELCQEFLKDFIASATDSDQDSPLMNGSHKAENHGVKASTKQEDLSDAQLRSIFYVMAPLLKEDAEEDAEEEVTVEKEDTKAVETAGCEQEATEDTCTTKADVTNLPADKHTPSEDERYAVKALKMSRHALLGWMDSTMHELNAAEKLPISSQWGKNSVDGEDEVLELLGELFDAYTPGCWWYEIFEFYRKLLMTSVIIFAGSGISQLAVGCAMSIVGLIATAKLKPYNDARLQVTQELALSLTVITLFTGILLLTAPDETMGDGRDKEIRDILIVVLYAICPVILLWFFSIHLTSCLKPLIQQFCGFLPCVKDENSTDDFADVENKDDQASLKEAENEPEDMKVKVTPKGQRTSEASAEAESSAGQIPPPDVLQVS
jgi:hypothetical protein